MSFSDSVSVFDGSWKEVLAFQFSTFLLLFFFLCFLSLAAMGLFLGGELCCPVGLIIDIKSTNHIEGYKILIDKNSDLTHFYFYSTTLHVSLVNSPLFNHF